MGFLRRILGGGERDLSARAAPPLEGADEAGPPDADEASRERELLRAEGERLGGDLLQRQLRYADRSWTPPRQGGERRAEDADGGGGR